MIKRNPSPKQLITLWANRAQKSTTIQTTGQRHTVTWGIDKKAQDTRQDTRRVSCPKQG